MYCYCIENGKMKMATTLKIVGLSPGFCTLGVGRFEDRGVCLQEIPLITEV